MIDKFPQDKAQLEESLEQLKDAIRDNPEKADLRFRLFELFSVIGEWEKAKVQVDTAARMNRTFQSAATWFGPALASEALRDDIFRGQRTPLIFGEPQEWVSWMVGALKAESAGEHAQARILRRRTLEAIPEIPAKINDQNVEWIIDADPRLGPILEVVAGGRYCWVPMTHILEIQVKPSGKLHDRVWVMAYFKWVNSGETFGLIPTRYAGSARCKDTDIQLAKVTDWRRENEGSGIIGLGHRQFVSDKDRLPLLNIRAIQWSGHTEEKDSSNDGKW